MVLAGVVLQLRSAMDHACDDAAAASGAKADHAPSRPEHAVHGPTVVPSAVPPDLVAGWTPLQLTRSAGKVELTLFGKSTLDKDEAIQRLHDAGCVAPKVSGMASWTIVCERAGNLRGVVVRSGARPGEGVLSWTSVIQ